MLTKLNLLLSKSIKNKKLNVFGVFLILSFLILAITKLSKNYTEVISFSIKHVNIPEDKVLVSNEDESIEVALSSLGFNLLPLYIYEPEVIIDFKTDVYLMDNQYVWIANTESHKLNSQLGNAIDLLSIKPDTLRFSFESLRVKKVPIILNTEVAFASGFDLLNDYKLNPDSVKVIGPEDAISKIENIHTEKLTLNNVNVNIDSDLELLMPKSIGTIKLSKQKVTIRADVEKFTEGILEVPVSIVNLPKEKTINYFPKSVTISYYVALNKFKHIKPIDFRVECDFLETIESQKPFFSPKLVKMPDSIKSARIKQAKVEFILIE